jgi:hypothetical protein
MKISCTDRVRNKSVKKNHEGQKWNTPQKLKRKKANWIGTCCLETAIIAG